MVEERIRITEALKEEQKSIGTHPNMTRLMINYLQKLSPITLHSVNGVLGAEEMTDLVDQQMLIGEHNFKAGWWTKVWKEKHDYLQNNGHNIKYSGGKWTPRAMKVVWNYVETLEVPKRFDSWRKQGEGTGNLTRMAGEGRLGSIQQLPSSRQAQNSILTN